MSVAHEVALDGSADSSDRMLLAGTARGDRASLTGLYDSYAATLLGRLIATGVSRDRAELLLQQAFRALWVIAPRLPAEAPVLNHLVRLIELHR